MTWTCHVCKKNRPDAAISVYKTDISAKYSLPSGTMSHNVRYCNDNPDCVSKAPTVDLLGPS